MALKEFAGAAPATRLSGSLAIGTTTNFAVVTGGGAGYPSGATAPFVIVVDRGTATEEKILVTSRAGDTFTGLSRGYDGTAASAHVAQAVVEHVLDAATVTEANAHVNTTARDDHTQYFNAARHAATAHTAAMIQDLTLGAADIADGAITSVKIQDATIATGDIADLAITYAKLEAAQRWEPGDMKMTARSAAPTGWLLCDGSLVSTTTYAALFAAIGHAYNAGADPGGGNFKLPDLRQKFPMGKAAAGTGSILGGTGGSKDAVAVTHNHTQDAHGHGSTGTDSPDHAHSTNNAGALAHSMNGVAANDVAVRLGSSVESLQFTGPTGTRASFTNINDHAAHGHGNTNGITANHAHSVGNATPTNQAAGVSGTDANLPAYQVVNYMVKT